MTPEEQDALERKVEGLTEAEFQDFLRRRNQARHDLDMMSDFWNWVPYIIIGFIIWWSMSQ